MVAARVARRRIGAAIAVCSGLVLMRPAGGWAQPLVAPPLTVIDAVARALREYPSIGVAEAGRVQARAGLREAETAQLPRVNVRATATRYQKETIVSPIHGFTPGATPPFDETLLQTALDGSYMLFDAGGRDARLAGARLSADAAATAVEGVRHLVAARVVSSYARILTEREVLEAHDRRIAALAAQRTRVQRLLDGPSPGYDIPG